MNESPEKIKRRRIKGKERGAALLRATIEIVKEYIEVDQDQGHEDV